jgi:hypothetical protein
MSTKTQKRQAQHYKEAFKSASERMSNLDDRGAAQLENYVTYQILYINDVACNACKFLGDELKTIPYKSKAVKTIYNALMKRVNAYWEFLNISKIDHYSLAELFEGMDDYLDDKIADFKEAMASCLKENGIDQSHWVASVECAATLCDYATVIAKDYIRAVYSVTPEAKYMLGLVIEEIFKVSRSLADTVQTIHVGKKVVDLNTNPQIVSAFKKLNKAFVNPENFIKAVTSADETNKAEGRPVLMY